MGAKPPRPSPSESQKGLSLPPCRIVHAGNDEALTDAAMREVTRVTRLVLERLLIATPFGRMSAERELERWFEQQLLAGGKRT